MKYVFEDRQGNLWLALGKGISEIEYKSPVFICDGRSDLTGLVLSVIKHNGNLYAGTTMGLYSLVRENSGLEGAASPDKFRPLAGIPDNCRSLLSIDGSLLAVAAAREESGREFELQIEPEAILTLYSDGPTILAYLRARRATCA